MSNEAEILRRKRSAAASRYQPASVKTLLVAEAPPADPGRYFYFEHVTTHDGLFRAVTEIVLGSKPDRDRKAEALGSLRDLGVFLIDLDPDPIENGQRGHLSALVPHLVERCRALSPERVIVIKATLWGLVHEPIRAAGLPLVEERIPFPSTGQQNKFRVTFGRAFHV